MSTGFQMRVYLPKPPLKGCLLKAAMPLGGCLVQVHVDRSLEVWFPMDPLPPFKQVIGNTFM